MSEAATPIVICATGVGVSCVQAVMDKVWPDLASLGVTGSSIIWGMVGCFAGDLIRSAKAEEEGKKRTKMQTSFLVVSTLFGALGGNWLARLMFGGDVVAVAGCAALIGAFWQTIVSRIVTAGVEAIVAAIAKGRG